MLNQTHTLVYSTLQDRIDTQIEFFDPKIKSGVQKYPKTDPLNIPINQTFGNGALSLRVSIHDQHS